MQLLPILLSLALTGLTVLIVDTLFRTKIAGNTNNNLAEYLRVLEGRPAVQSQFKVVTKYLTKLAANPFLRLNIGSNKQKEIMNQQLKDALHSLAASLKAGYSLTTALERCQVDLKRTLTDQRKKPILDEMTILVKNLQLGDSVENALQKFRDKLDQEDVNDLVNGILITRNKGGNLAEIMESIAQTITEKIEVTQEIRVLTASKVIEARFLGTLPLVMLSILTVTSPEYMAPLYETSVGQAIIVLGLLLILAGFVVAKKLTEIDV